MNKEIIIGIFLIFLGLLIAAIMGLWGNYCIQKGRTKLSEKSTQDIIYNSNINKEEIIESSNKNTQVLGDKLDHILNKAIKNYDSKFMDIRLKEETGYTYSEIKVFAKKAIKEAQNDLIIGNSYFVTGNYEKSIKHLSNALERLPESKKGSVYFNRAQAEYRYILKKSNYKIIGKLEDYLLSKYESNFEKIISDLNKANQLETEYSYHYQSYISLGLIYVHLGKYNIAHEMFDTAIHLNDLLPDAYLEKGALLIYENKYDDALINVMLANEKYPNNSNIISAVGCVYLLVDKKNEALKYLNKAIFLNPEELTAFLHLANLYFDNSEYGLAIENYNVVIGKLYTKISNSAENNFLEEYAYYGRGKSHDAQNKKELAIKDFSSAIKVNDRNPNSFFLRGTIYFSTGKSHLALEDFNKTIELDEYFTYVYVSRGNNYFYNFKDYKRAFNDYEEEIKRNPSSGMAYFARGVAYQKLNQKNKALLDFENALDKTDINQSTVENAILNLRWKRFKLLDFFKDNQSTLSK